MVACKIMFELVVYFIYAQRYVSFVFRYIWHGLAFCIFATISFGIDNVFLELVMSKWPVVSWLAWLPLQPILTT
jgi:hypothetical protein